MNAVSTAENGVVNARTEFLFRQVERHVSAEYAGGGVVRGHLVGILDGARLTFRYAQLEQGDVLNSGRSSCEVERTPDGRLRILEHFEWESRPGGGTNVFEELPDPADGAPDSGWRALFERHAGRRALGAPRFRPPAAPEALAALERALGVALPDELRALLAETDGVEDAHGCWLVWDVARLRSENERFRRRSDGLETCMSFEDLLFFSDAPGNGDAYAVCTRSADGFRRSDVFRWDHEDDSRTRVAASLRAWVVAEL